MGNQAALQFVTILLLSIVLVSLQFGRGIFLIGTRGFAPNDITYAFKRINNKSAF